MAVVSTSAEASHCVIHTESVVQAIYEHCLAIALNSVVWERFRGITRPSREAGSHVYSALIPS